MQRRLNFTEAVIRIPRDVNRPCPLIVVTYKIGLDVIKSCLRLHLPILSGINTMSSDTDTFLITLHLMVLIEVEEYTASSYYRVKKNQLDAQLILSIFREPLYVSGVSRPIIRRYNRMYTTVGTYYSL